MFPLAILIVFLFESFQINTISLDKKENKKDTLYTNIKGQGIQITIDFKSGKAHNYPTMAFWIEDMEGNFVQPLYVTKSLATGIYGHAEAEKGKWKHESGEVRRPATLPYFLHKRGVKANDGTYLPTSESPIPDAYTGATPKKDFILFSRSEENLKNKFRVMMEINQAWDWNEHWNNTKFPDDFDYNTSCQPALVYSVTIDLENKEIEKYFLNPIGHSHFSGKNGNLYTNLNTISTALNIIDKVEITLK
jgi:hypothetical protein